jgi:hypothetical protein
MLSTGVKSKYKPNTVWRIIKMATSTEFDFCIADNDLPYTFEDRQLLRACEAVTRVVGESRLIDRASEELVAAVWGDGSHTLAEALKNPLAAFSSSSSPEKIADSLRVFTAAIDAELTVVVDRDWCDPKVASNVEKRFIKRLGHSTLGKFMSSPAIEAA